MRIGLINIGDELLAGKTLNTNAFDLALWLGELGHELVFTLAIADRFSTIAGALRAGLSEDETLPPCEWLILTGGLGPTADDLTRPAVAAFLGVPLETNSLAAQWLGERLGIHPHAIAEGQRTQLELPQGAEPLHNPAGTACGFQLILGRKKVLAMPGVPSEFKAMFNLHCRPYLISSDAVLLRRSLITFDLSESLQREYLRNFLPPTPFRYSSLPTSTGHVTIALEAFVSNAERELREKTLASSWAELIALLPAESIVDNDGLDLSGAVHKLLGAHGATVAVAESCTAGLLGSMLTETPGSSAIFHQGYLTYANQAKTKVLGVDSHLLLQHGAVSAQVAEAMAQGCRRVSGSTYSVAITGIAGPGGGSIEKPVGLVFIAVASSQRCEVTRFQLRGQRQNIRLRAAYSALNCLRLFIIKDLENK